MCGALDSQEVFGAARAHDLGCRRLGITSGSTGQLGIRRPLDIRSQGARACWVVWLTSTRGGPLVRSDPPTHRSSLDKHPGCGPSPGPWAEPLHVAGVV